MSKSRFVPMLLVVFFSCLLIGHKSLALTTEQNSAHDNASAAGLADPDEKTSVFMTSPDNDIGQRGVSSTSSTVTMPSLQDSSPGAQAFDRAFTHQQDK